MWSRAAGCEETIHQTWDSSSSVLAGQRLSRNLCHVLQELITWEKATFGSVNRQVKELEEAMLNLDKRTSDTTTLARRADLHRQLNELLAREEII
ncbi:UNVERIFIED_CONTAM: hypothetical protein Slati_2659500 [Sesamum latifolium]|uniref:Uncharacterized protein n=1 Tax=Sesamum latifolium TaxID=2727402 RepID=A0AAW2VVA5_9LAMI